MIKRVWFSSVILACFVGGLVAATTAAGDRSQAGRFDKRTMPEPKLIHKVPPKYPADAKKEGVEGTVVLDAVLGKDGAIRETRVKQGADVRLVDAARAAVEQWRYEPVLNAQGEPVEAVFTVTVRFKIDKK
jgi:TonB family protein